MNGAHNLVVGARVGGGTLGCVHSVALAELRSSRGGTAGESAAATGASVAAAHPRTIPSLLAKFNNRGKVGGVENEAALLVQLNDSRVPAVTQLVRSVGALRSNKLGFFDAPSGGDAFMLMQNAGVPVWQEIPDKGRQAWAASIAQWLLTVVEEVHARGINHGDISPSNIVKNGMGLTLIDYGCAQRVKNGEASSVRLRGWSPKFSSHLDALSQAADVEAILWSVTFLLGIKLPWSSACVGPEFDRAEIAAMKLQALQNPDSFPSKYRYIVKAFASAIFGRQITHADYERLRKTLDYALTSGGRGEVRDVIGLRIRVRAEAGMAGFENVEMKSCHGLSVIQQLFSMAMQVPEITSMLHLETANSIVALKFVDTLAAWCSSLHDFLDPRPLFAAAEEAVPDGVKVLFRYLRQEDAQETCNALLNTSPMLWNALCVDMRDVVSCKKGHRSGDKPSAAFVVPFGIDPAYLEAMDAPDEWSLTDPKFLEYPVPKTEFWKCGCEKGVKQTNKTVIHSVQKVVIFHIKRFYFDPLSKTPGKYHYAVNVPIEFPLETGDGRSRLLGCRGFIVHIGEDASSGHYISYVRDYRDVGGHTWVELSDEKVRRVTWKDATATSTRTVYMVFYDVVR